MPDLFDRAQEREEIDRQAAIRAARGDVPAGTPGECGLCGEDHPRLVLRVVLGDSVMVCPRCRDARELG